MTVMMMIIIIMSGNNMVNESETNTVCGERPCVDPTVRGKILRFEK